MTLVNLPKFLIVDDNAENRFFITKTLLRKYPQATLQECQDSVPAKIAAELERLTAIIVHRSSDMEGIELIRSLRHVNRTIPIVMVSGRETYPEVLEAGADAFLNYDAWLRIGTVVEELLAAREDGKTASTGLSPASASSRSLGLGM